MSEPNPQPIATWRPLFPGQGAPPEPQARAPVSSEPPAQVGLRPRFQRTPREYLAPPTDEIEVQAPGQAPSVPHTTWVTIALPIVGLGLTIGIGLVVNNLAASNGSAVFGGGLTVLISAPIMLLSAAGSLYNHLSVRRRFRQALVQRERDYRLYLAERRKALEALRQTQRQAMMLPHPSIIHCERIIGQRERQLWSRSPSDQDFVCLRVGQGVAAASFKIKPPTLPNATSTPEPLLVEALQLCQDYGKTPEVPMTMALAQVRAAGLVGSRASLAQTTRALIIQAVTHHSPAELKLLLHYPQAEADDWQWTRWLPHVWNEERTRRNLAANVDQARLMLHELVELLKQRQVQQQYAPARPSQAFLVILADPTGVGGGNATDLHVLLQFLLTVGPSLGVYCVMLHQRPEDVHKECGAIVDMRPNPASLRLMRPNTVDFDFIPDSIDAVASERAARSLAPLRASQAAETTSLPNSVTLLDLFGVDRVEDLQVKDRWQRSLPYKALAVPVGMRLNNRLQALDLHEPPPERDLDHGHGPNGLVAGMVGSGKSELLQALVASLAVNFHPHEVAFALLDFKGGDMLAPLRDLPHVLCHITNLEIELVPRALTSLEAELERRERLFAAVKDRLGIDVKHLDQYLELKRQGRVADALPYLVLIVDEYTVLRNALPDIMQKFILVAVKGRSLGFRMILATQRPAGVVSPQIESNTRLRLCLKVAQPEDSSELLKRNDAATLTQAGRCYLRVGNDEVFELFQCAWSGAPYAPNQSAMQRNNLVAEVALDGRLRPLNSADTSRVAPDLLGKSQLQAVVAQIARVAVASGLARLPAPWHPPLPDALTLSQVRSSTSGWNGISWHAPADWLMPVIGLSDMPRQQAQSALRVPLGQVGHLLVIGAPSSGKTTLLTTLILSLMLDHSPAEVNLYLLDFGGRQLQLFAGLPHIGAVITLDEPERLRRLMRMLNRMLDQRKLLISQSGAGTLAAYRVKHPDGPPAVIVVLDNFAEVASGHPALVDDLSRLAREGSNLGLHLVITGTTPSTVTSKVATNMSLALALELNDPSDYAMIVGRPTSLPPRGVRGRAMWRGVPPTEVQIASPAAGSDDFSRSEALRAQLKRLAASWMGPVAPDVPLMPAIVPLSRFVQQVDTWDVARRTLAMVVGLEMEALDPLSVDLVDGPSFLITGPAASGKTSFLQSWLLALTEAVPPTQLKLFLLCLGSPNLIAFGRLPHATLVEDDERLLAMLDSLLLEINERRQRVDQARRNPSADIDEANILQDSPAIVISIDDFDLFRQNAKDSSKQRLEHIIRRGRGYGVYFLVAGPLTEFNSTTDPVARVLKESQVGFLLGSSDYSDANGVFGLKLATADQGKPMQPGRAIAARRGQYTVCKLATWRAGQVGLAAWLSSIANKQFGP